MVHFNFIGKGVNMRKSFVTIFIGIFVIVTILFLKGGSRIYEKKVSFSNEEEIVETLNSNIIMTYDNEGNLVYSNDFLECLSKRERLFQDFFLGDRLDLEIDNSLEAQERAKILQEEYLERVKSFKNYEGKTFKKTIALKGKVRQCLNTQWQNILMELVLIDEGEGLVIDFIGYSIQYEGENDYIKY